MKVSAWSQPPSTTAQPAAGQYDLTTPVGTPALFRRVFRVSLPGDAMADGLALIGAHLEGTFAALDYNAVAAPTPALAANVTAKNGLLVVTLDAPRQIVRVRLGVAAASSDSVALYRMDADTVAPQPTLVVQRYGLDVIYQTVQVRQRAMAPAQEAAQAAGQEMVQAGGYLTAEYSFSFTDQHFALEARDSSGARLTLTAADLSELRVHSEPANASLALAEYPETGQTGAAPPLFWPPPAGTGTPSPAFTAGNDLKDALARLLARRTGPLPPVLLLDITAQSSAPCRLRVDAFEVEYHLTRTGFASSADKQVLRFDGRDPRPRTVTLSLPGGATVHDAPLTAVPSLRGGGPAAGADLPALATLREGVLLGAGQRAAQSLTPADALTVDGLALGIVPLADKVRLALELRADHQGRPAGQRLGGGEIALGAAGRRQWARVTLDAPVVMPAQPCWLVASTTGGSAVALKENDTASVDVYADPGLDQPRAIDRMALAARLLGPAGGGDALQVRVAGQTIPASGSGESIEFLLAGALTAALAGTPAGVAFTVAVDVTSDRPGSVTLYPLRAQYSPAT